jgi:hypothetical protein
MDQNSRHCSEVQHMDLQTIGRILLVIGIVVVFLGLALMLLGRGGFLSNFPGTLRVEGQGFSCVVPILASIILSILLTVVLNIIIRFINRP